MKILKYDENTKESFSQFLKQVPSLQNLDEEILYNAYGLFDNDLMGVISYERFDDCGLIRYFVFNAKVSDEELYQLFSSLEKECQGSVKQLFALVENEILEQLFYSFGFKENPSDYVILNETVVSSMTSKNDHPVIVVSKAISTSPQSMT